MTTIQIKQDTNETHHRLLKKARIDGDIERVNDTTLRKLEFRKFKFIIIEEKDTKL